MNQKWGAIPAASLISPLIAFKCFLILFGSHCRSTNEVRIYSAKCGQRFCFHLDATNIATGFRRENCVLAGLSAMGKLSKSWLISAIEVPNATADSSSPFTPFGVFRMTALCRWVAN